MPSTEEMEAMRLDVMTGRDLLKAEIEQCSLDVCGHCGSAAEIRFVLQKPYGACTNGECGATTGTADEMTEAAAKWNRRHG